LPIGGTKLKSALEKDVKNWDSWRNKTQIAILKASTKLIDDNESTVLKKSNIRNKFDIVSDEPKNRGGADKGPAPLEYMLASFEQCLVTVYAYHAALHDLQLNGVEVNAEGFCDVRGVYDIAPREDLAGRGFEKIIYETHIESDESEDKIKWLVKTSEKCCPAHGTLRRACPLESTIFFNGKMLMNIKYSPD
jgi:uncharacterized OsmC-like protein